MRRFGNHFRQAPRVSSGFTLIEILVVVALIALLMAILLPSLANAREQARATVCGAHLRQIGLAARSYGETHRGWMAGSPNTSGNGARPGFLARPYEGDRFHFPSLHVFDWANPLLVEMNTRPPDDFQARYEAAVTGVMQCPSNRRPADRVELLETLLPENTIAPSYAASRYFQYVGEGVKTGDVRGTLWWSEDSIPPNYAPRFERLEKPGVKAFLADAHVVSEDRGVLNNANWGFSSHGAWRSHEMEDPAAYRGETWKSEYFRHRGAINILAYDGHVELQRDEDGRANGGQGLGARRARWWFPSGTQVEFLPSRRASEPKIIIP